MNVRTNRHHPHYREDHLPVEDTMGHNGRQYRTSKSSSGVILDQHRDDLEPCSVVSFRSPSSCWLACPAARPPPLPSPSSASPSTCSSLPSFSITSLPSLSPTCVSHRSWPKWPLLPLLQLHLLLVILVSVSTFAQALNPLNTNIRHYEPLSYDHKSLLNAFHKTRRAATECQRDHFKVNSQIDFHFDAHGRQFPIRVKRDTNSVFHPNLVIEDGDGREVSVDLDHLVTGHLHNQPNSLVYGSVRDGVFQGKIHSTVPHPEVFYVERAHKYFPPESTTIYLLDQDRVNSTHSANYDLYHLVRSVQLGASTTPVPRAQALPFHSVIYSSNHVIDPHQADRSPMDGACGADADVRAWMDRVANSAVDQNDQVDQTSGEYSSSANSSGHKEQRSKRATNYHNYRVPFEAQGRISHRPTVPPQQSTPFLPTKRACSLYIQTDTFLWDHVKKHESEKSDSKVREEIASLVAQHIKAVNHIYETSIFKDIIGLKFIVQRLRINDSSSCEGKKRESNQFCSPNIDVSNFLNLNSQFNHNDFCLAYIFTYRDFSGGTLGLAWVASTSGASGGICEKYKTYTENIGGRQVQTKRSLNTGIITFVNYNSRVPPKVSELTLAHEIGHNFGSPHDYPAECRPGGPLGNFIMYSSATSGERQNNNKFSHCSVNNISSVLRSVFNNEGKENCFQEDNGPFCGNKIVEEGEECDCGYDSRECNEDCCYPRNVEEFKNHDAYAQPCRRRPGAYCSPSEGPCCTEKCTFEGDNKQCRDDGECTYKSLCDGQRAHCPSPPAKPNKTECNMGTQVCSKGSCTGSICQKYDLEECFLTAKRGAKAEEMCEVACQRRSQPETCRRTSEIEIMKNVSGLKLRPGSPCNDFQGYCDVFQRCRPVDAEGPLARLKNLLFNKKTLISIKQWVTTYWWACTLMMFGAILFMAAFIKCCAVHTPSSNPKRKKALRLTDTLRRPADTLRRKSRERSHGAVSGHHRSSREHSNGRSHRDQRGQSQQQISQQMPLTSMHAQSNHAAAHHAGYHQSAQSGPSSSASPNPAGPFPPTLVVNLPPAKDSNLPQQPFDPPPPYPGMPKPSAPPLNLVASSVNGGPSHGYGEGRGHYNRQGQTNVPTAAKTPVAKGKKSESDPKSRR